MPPLAVEVEISRHINMETIGAHEAAADLLFDVEMTGEQFTLLTRWNRADQCAYSARPQAVEALFEYLFVAARVERTVDAAVAQSHDFLDRTDFRALTLST